MLQPFSLLQHLVNPIHYSCNKNRMKKIKCMSYTSQIKLKTKQCVNVHGFKLCPNVLKCFKFIWINHILSVKVCIHTLYNQIWLYDLQIEKNPTVYKCVIVCFYGVVFESKKKRSSTNANSTWRISNVVLNLNKTFMANPLRNDVMSKSLFVEIYRTGHTSMLKM